MSQPHRETIAIKAEGRRLGSLKSAESESGGAHQFEEDEEVEQIAGEREAAHGGEKEKHERLEAIAAGIDKVPRDQ